MEFNVNKFKSLVLLGFLCVGVSQAGFSSTISDKELIEGKLAMKENINEQNKANFKAALGGTLKVPEGEEMPPEEELKALLKTSEDNSEKIAKFRQDLENGIDPFLVWDKARDLPVMD